MQQINDERNVNCIANVGVEIAEMPDGPLDHAAIHRTSPDAPHSPDINSLNPVLKKAPIPRICIEVYPGFEQPLRLSVETLDAIRMGFTRNVGCQLCTLEVGCIQDARYVLCPVCYTVTPLDFDVAADCGSNFGIGLGFIEDGTDVASLEGYSKEHASASLPVS